MLEDFSRLVVGYRGCYRREIQEEVGWIWGDIYVYIYREINRVNIRKEF